MARKWNESHPNQKGRNKIVPVYRWHDVKYRKPYSNKKLLELINEFSKVAGYKVNMQKLAVFLYLTYELSEKEIGEIIPLIIASKRIK